jgi:uncharacterized surface protein with fasciclin (FAS1) repeats
MRAMRRTAIAVVSVAAALTLSACGGSTDGATTSESSSAIKGGVEAGDAIEEEAELEADSQGLSANNVCPDVSPADILSCLESNGNFTNFLSGLNGDLVDELSKGGPLTVFAPTDDAFEALGDEVLALVSEDEEWLSKIMAHHIKDGVYYTPDFLEGGIKFLDLTGFSDIETDTNGVLFVDGAVVTSGDNVVDNGIIHVIDKVLTPEGFEE